MEQDFGLSKRPNTRFIPPADIVSTYSRFQKFYFDKHNGRKLTWLWQLCKGEIKANYIKNAKIPYTFQVSTYQMAILLLFNDADVVSYEEAQTGTALSPDWLDPSLAVFVKAKVLIPEPESGKPEPGTSYSLNHNFKNKKVKVNLNITVKSEAKQEVEDTQKTIEEDRKLLMQVRMLFPLLLSWKVSNLEVLMLYIAVGHCPYNEVSQEDEACRPCSRDHFTNQESFYAQDSRYQEIDRPAY